MYAWIWRHLPFGLPGKIIGSVLLVGGAVSLLWFWVFPATSGWVEDFLLPFDQSTIDTSWHPGDGSPSPTVEGEGTGGESAPPETDD
jgi:hypothetical protein